MKKRASANDAQIRVRLPTETKKWLEHLAVDLNLSQQDTALHILELFRAKNPKYTLKADARF